MAEKRMFAQSVIESDLFLDMPATAQMLYIHLCMNADDDGFNDKVKTIQRMVGATAKDLNLLIEQEFLISFPSGVHVVRHWKRNNTMRTDRYTPTVHREEFSMLEYDNETKCYFLVSTGCTDPVSTGCTDPVPQNRKEENRVEEKRINITSIASAPDAPVAPAPRNHFSQEFESVWEKYPRREGKKKARDAFIKARKEGVPLDDIMKGVDAYAAMIKRENKETQYIAHGSTWFNQRRWEDDYSAKEAADGYDCYENLGIVF